MIRSPTRASRSGPGSVPLPPMEPLPPPPANAVVVDWLSYTQAMAAADLVICRTAPLDAW